MTTGLVIGVFAILVLALVVGPLMARARRIAAPDAVRATRQERGRSGTGVTAPASPSRLPPPPASGGGGRLVGMGKEQAPLDAARIEGRVKASSVKKMGEIVGKHPDEALAVVRSWMNKDQ